MARATILGMKTLRVKGVFHDFSASFARCGLRRMLRARWVRYPWFHYVDRFPFLASAGRAVAAAHARQARRRRRRGACRGRICASFCRSLAVCPHAASHGRGGERRRGRREVRPRPSRLDRHLARGALSRARRHALVAHCLRPVRRGRARKGAGAACGWPPRRRRSLCPCAFALCGPARDAPVCPHLHLVRKRRGGRADRRAALLRGLRRLPYRARVSPRRGGRRARTFFRARRHRRRLRRR